jgi:hypothetical protein
LGIENQPVRLWPNGNKIEVLSDTLYQERKGEGSANPVEEVDTLEQAGMPK